MPSKVEPLPSISLYLQKLTAWLTLKWFILTVVILSGAIGLGPDEAQYWTWSRSLDWGYYSKPPGIAWQIWLSTALFGQTEWGVRSIAAALSFIQAYLLFFTAIRAGWQPRSAYWSALMMAFSPLGILGSLFATTDGGLVFCWTGACFVSAAAWLKKESPNPLLVGMWIFFGLFFKWSMGLFWGFYLAFALINRTIPTVVCLFLGVILSSLALLPSVWWNYSHDWATFRHVFSTLQGGSMGQAGGNPLEFISSQFFLFSPILFILLLCSLSPLLREKSLATANRPLLYFAIITFTLIFGAFFVSFSQKVQGNWIAFAYPTAFLVAGWFAFQSHSAYSRWVIGGITLSICLCTCLLYFGATTTNQTAFRLNSLKHNLGWQQLRETLTKVGYHPNIHFLASDKYQTTSELSFYSEGQKRGYFININNARNNQFSYWPAIDKAEKGKSGFFVWIENSPYLEREREKKELFYRQTLPHYFEKVHFLGAFPLISNSDAALKMALIYLCENPKELDLLQTNLW